MPYQKCVLLIRALSGYPPYGTAPAMLRKHLFRKNDVRSA